MDYLKADVRVSLFLFSRWEPPIRVAPEFFQELSMSSTLKHAFSSLAWYTRQDAEAWKMLTFLVGVVAFATAIAWVSNVPFSL